MDAEKLAGTVGEGLSGLLLEPVYFIYEIYSAILPGLVFVLLLFEKHNDIALSLLRNQLLGYKTKLALCILLSYAAGKVLGLPFAFLTRAGTSFPGEKENPQQKGTIRALHGFLAGFVLSALMAKRHSLSYLALALCNAAFYFVTGSALVVASAIPGDGYLRLWELSLGVALIAVGWREQESMVTLALALLGSAAADWIASKASIAQALAVATGVLETLKQAAQVKQGTSSAEVAVTEGRQNGAPPIATKNAEPVVHQQQAQQEVRHEAQPHAK